MWRCVCGDGGPVVVWVCGGVCGDGGPVVVWVCGGVCVVMVDQW